MPKINIIEWNKLYDKSKNQIKVYFYYKLNKLYDINKLKEMYKMPNNNQSNRRLGQTETMTRNNQSDRQARLNRLLRRTTEEEVIEPRNRQERREQGIRNPISEQERNSSTSWISSARGSAWTVPNFMQEYTMQWFDSSSGESRTATCNSIPVNPKYIKQHNYIPNKFNFHKTNLDNDNLFMGVELEIDQGGESDDNAKFIQEFLGEDNCYIMHDGSLSKGLEITTHPCSLDYHKSLPYQDLFKQLIDKGYKSHDTQTCGLHVHVNRNFFGGDLTLQDLCITKVLYLLEKHWDNIKVIARRDSSRFAERFFMKDNESLFTLLAKAKGEYGHMYNNAKYQIVNLLHKDTVEFRLFKGTIKYETFMATLEFVRNLVYLCKNKPLEQIQMTTFGEIIHVLESEYLVNYLKERGINILENVAV